MNVICGILLAMFGMVPDSTSVTVLVADGDTGEPVEGARVEIAFTPGVAKDGTTCGGVRIRKTNARGMCKGSGTAASTYVSIHAEKAGFYPSEWRAALLPGEDRREHTEFSVVTVAIRRVEHPIPLFVAAEPNRRPADIFGKGTNTLEFDMMEGDYLPPVGKGKTADIVFTREPCELLGEVNGIDWGVKKLTKDSVRIRFPNAGDGIVSLPPTSASELIIRMAPESGYRPDYLACRTRNESGVVKSWEADPNLCFRIRTKFDAEGSVVSAIYGKIYGGIGFEHDYSERKIGEPRVGRMRFMYYLNPKLMDRNLEYNFGNNLNKSGYPVIQRP